MKLSKQARRDATQLFRTCMVQGHLADDRVRRVVREVLARKPRGYLPILTHFQRLLRLEIARRSARVESATALPADLRASVQGSLDRLYGAGLAVAFVANPALVGGLRVQVGSDVYDGSIEGRLTLLQDRF